VKSKVAQLGVPDPPPVPWPPKPKGSGACFDDVTGANGSAVGFEIVVAAKGSEPNRSKTEAFVGPGPGAGAGAVTTAGANGSETCLDAEGGAKGSDTGAVATTGSTSALKSIKLIILSELTRFTAGAGSFASPLPT